MGATITKRIYSSTESWVEEFYVTDCASCGVVFAMPKSLEQRRRADGASFYCPNGHSMLFRETEVTKLEKRLAAQREHSEWLAAERQRAKDEAARARRQASAARGQLTKLRNRVANGVCPQGGCKRSFTNLHDHVRTCHPDLVAAIEVPA